MESAEDIGRRLLDNSKTFEALASDSASFGLDVRNDLQRLDLNGSKLDAARFVGYEVAEAVRKGVFEELKSREEDVVELNANLVDGDSLMNKL